jgi:hypothetical protein
LKEEKAQVGSLACLIQVDMGVHGLWVMVALSGFEVSYHTMYTFLFFLTVLELNIISFLLINL